MNKEDIFNFIKNNNINKIKKWLKLYPNDVNSKDNKGWIPLHDACKSNHLGIVKLLVEKGADVNCKDNAGDSVLDYLNYLNDGNKQVFLNLIERCKLPLTLT